MFKDECKPYINKYGTFNQSPNEDTQNSGNALLYFGHYIRVIIENKLDFFAPEFKKIVEQYYCVDTGGQQLAGLLNRYPNNNHEKQAHDDVVGILSAAQRVCPEVAHQIFNYLRIHSFLYNNQKSERWVRLEFKGGLVPKFSTDYLGRHPGFVAHAYFSNNYKPSWFQRVLWGANLLYNAYKQDGQSGTLLCWHYVKTFEDSKVEAPTLKKIVALWKKKLEKEFPYGKMGEVFGEYFNPNHPFALYMEGLI